MTLFLDDNLEQQPDGQVVCRHCAQVLGDAAAPMRDALVRETLPANAGPSVREDAARFTDRPVVFRQTFCPQCLTQLQAEIVPGDEPSSRHRSLVVGA
ncbi:MULTISPECIES: hypothetical protein [unclassified Amycolatopsis]|uniref:hypothetical protein n=1 Tax=unclassified Amycolatopsis TaxID=2618356 RepID=UPI0034529135